METISASRGLIEIKSSNDDEQAKDVDEPRKV